MSLLRNLARAAALGIALAIAAPAVADEISPSHLQAALDALRSAKASSNFDMLLPTIVDKVKNQLIQIRPDLHNEISEIVDAVALKLIPRRVDLDNDIARIWAKAFSEDELVSIATFYKSPAGQKFSTTGPAVLSDTFQAAKAWSDRVGEELLQKSRDELKAKGVDF
jgi:hypothetical protein